VILTYMRNQKAAEHSCARQLSHQHDRWSSVSYLTPIPITGSAIRFTRRWKFYEFVKVSPALGRRDACLNKALPAIVKA
jgi:hypothetical protein